MSALRILVACETSGIARRAFAEHGHDVWSCDLEPAEAHARASIAKQIWNGARIYLQAIKTIEAAAKPVAQIGDAAND